MKLKIKPYIFQKINGNILYLKQQYNNNNNK